MNKDAHSELSKTKYNLIQEYLGNIPSSYSQHSTDSHHHHHPNSSSWELADELYPEDSVTFISRFIPQPIDKPKDAAKSRQKKLFEGNGVGVGPEPQNQRKPGTLERLSLKAKSKIPRQVGMFQKGKNSISILPPVSDPVHAPSIPVPIETDEHGIDNDKKDDHAHDMSLEQTKDIDTTGKTENNVKTVETQTQTETQTPKPQIKRRIKTVWDILTPDPTNDYLPNKTPEKLLQFEDLDTHPSHFNPNSHFLSDDRFQLRPNELPPCFNDDFQVADGDLCTDEIIRDLKHDLYRYVDNAVLRNRPLLYTENTTNDRYEGDFHNYLDSSYEQQCHNLGRAFNYYDHDEECGDDCSTYEEYETAIDYISQYQDEMMDFEEEKQNVILSHSRLVDNHVQLKKSDMWRPRRL